MPLTGPPRIADALLPYMGEGLWADVKWRDESTYRTYADGTVELVEARFRPYGTGGWRSLSYPDIKSIHGLTERPFLFVPRTWAEGDEEDEPELALTVRRTSDLQETTPLTRRSADDALRYAFEFAWEGVETFERIPEAIYGGFYLRSQTEHTAEVERWGDATMAEGTPEDVTFLGVLHAGALVPVDLGPDAVTDRLITETADGLGVVIDFLNTFKAPTEA